MKDISYYIANPHSEFLNRLFEVCPTPWSPLERLPVQIEHHFTLLKDQGTLLAKRGILNNSDGSLREGSYFIQETEVLKQDFIDTELRIYIGAGTLVEAGATIKNHTIVENSCEIRQGAYLRGFAYIGERSVVGHTTEIKNTIFTQHVEAGHFAYIGDTIIGAYVNLGAGTKISNLEFRSLDAKQNDLFPEISIKEEGETIKTGLSKFGAIIGDGCETGCNSVLCPFVFLGPKCWVMPNHCVLKGFYKKGSLLRPSSKRGNT